MRREGNAARGQIQEWDDYGKPWAFGSRDLTEHESKRESSSSAPPIKTATSTLPRRRLILRPSLTGLVDDVREVAGPKALGRESKSKLITGRLRVLIAWQPMELWEPF